METKVESKVEKYLRVTMPDGSKYDVPAKLIAEDRAKYYAKLDSERGDADYDEAYRNEFDFTMENDFELKDWAANNMNWDDVKDHAVKVEEVVEVDFQEGWVNGPKDIVENMEKD